MINYSNSSKVINFLLTSKQRKTSCCSGYIKIIVNKTTANTKLFFYCLKRETTNKCNLLLGSRKTSLWQIKKIIDAKRNTISTWNRFIIISSITKTLCSSWRVPLYVTVVLILNKIIATSNKTYVLIIRKKVHDKKCISSIFFSLQT